MCLIFVFVNLVKFVNMTSMSRQKKQKNNETQIKTKHAKNCTETETAACWAGGTVTASEVGVFTGELQHHNCQLCELKTKQTSERISCEMQ